MLKNNLKTAAVIILITTGSGCSWFQPRAVTLCEPLPKPPRPVLPTLAADDLQCVTGDAYRRLLMREITRRHYAEQLEVIIREHNKGCDK